MADVGAYLPLPESGWKRYDSIHPAVRYSGSWTTTGSASDRYGGTYQYTKSSSATCDFSFEGTGLRIIGQRNAGFSTDVVVAVDGVEHHYSNEGSKAATALLFELTGLVNTRHTVSIRTNIEGKEVNVDAFDVVEGGHIAYTIGYRIPEQEEGWRRYDDLHPAIAYKGNWTVVSHNNFYNKGQSISTSTVDGDSSLHFEFYGTKLRIISSKSLDKSEKIEIVIDGKRESFSEKDSEAYGILVYEKLGLHEGVHKVSISQYGAGYIGLDAVDIDVDGYLITPQQPPTTGGKLRFKVTDMDIGDFIRCGYTASEGKAGLFYGLGTAKDEAEIPKEGASAPDGYFYFIKVREGLLIADRVIQYGVAWTTLNEAGYTYGVPFNDSLVPIMASDTMPMPNVAPNGAIFASNVYSSSYPAWKAFDCVEDNYGWLLLNGQKQGWLEYAFDSPIAIKKYSLQAPGYPTEMPGKWTFEGWDGMDWICLDSQEYTGWGPYEERTFAVDNTREFKRYRIYIEKNDGHNSYTGIGEFRLRDERIITKVRMMTGGIAYMRFDGHPTQYDEGIGMFPADNEWDVYIKNGQWGPEVWGYTNGMITSEWTQDTPFSGFTNPPSGFINNGNGRTVRGRLGSASEYWSTVSTYTTPSKIGFRPIIEYYHI